MLTAAYVIERAVAVGALRRRPARRVDGRGDLVLDRAALRSRVVSFFITAGWRSEAEDLAGQSTRTKESWGAALMGGSPSLVSAR